MKKRKIALIGMPSAGKTTVGKALATALGYVFYDLDRMVEECEGQDLITVLETKGARYFLDMEYDFLKKIPDNEAVVISPAGSIIYHEEATRWIEQGTFAVFLDTPLSIIESRLSIQPKAVVGLKEKGLNKLYKERLPLYTQLANATVSTANKTVEEIIKEIMSLYEY